MHHAIKFDERESDTIANKLPHLPKELARQFFKSGEWVNEKAGAILINENQAIDYFYYIRSGSASVSRSKMKVAKCNANEFVGEITCFSGEPATGTVKVTSSAELFRIDIETLRKIAPEGSALRQTIEQSIADDLRIKIGGKNNQTWIDDESKQNSMGILKDIDIVSAA